jgi:hypothetical protein
MIFSGVGTPSAMTDVEELSSLGELARLVRDRPELYVRWAPKPDEPATSRDELTGAELPGVSVNPLDPEPWWDDLPLELWLARQLYDYCHLRHDRPRRMTAWILAGGVDGRGPDNEPLLTKPEPVARLSEAVLGEARQLLESCSKPSARWGPMRRPPDIEGDRASR